VWKLIIQDTCPDSHTNVLASLSKKNIKFPFITLDKKIFLLIMQEVLRTMFYISRKYGPNLCRERKQFFVPQKTLSLFPLKPQIFAFRSTDINFVFSDIRHENKQSLLSG
jgi:hypothetical protein